MMCLKNWDNPRNIHPFSCLPLRTVRWKIYCVPPKAFPKSIPLHSTPLYSQVTECLSHCFSYFFLLYPLLLSIPTLPSLIHCTVYLFSPSLHPTSTSPFSSRLSGFHQVSPLAPYWRPPGVEPAVADNLPRGCPHPQPNTLPFFLPRSEQHIFRWIKHKKMWKFQLFQTLVLPQKHVFSISVTLKEWRYQLCP